MLFFLSACGLYIVAHYFGKMFFSFGKSALLGVVILAAGLFAIYRRVGTGDITSIFSPSATGGVSPDVTWDSGYTEAPDETAHGDYMKLMASAGLAFDRVHLNYLAHAKLRINRTEREQSGKVTWRIERQRPNLPASETEPPRIQP